MFFKIIYVPHAKVIYFNVKYKEHGLCNFYIYKINTFLNLNKGYSTIMKKLNVPNLDLD